MKPEGFAFYRCDKAFTLGVNTPNLSKILKCAGNDDVVTLKCEEQNDCLTLVFESPSQDRISDFEFKLMDIESEHLGIPESEYKCTVRMPSAEFQRIIRDIGVFGDTCTISVTKDGIRFSSSGDLGTGNIMLKPNSAVDKDTDAVVIDIQEPVSLNFALRYLTLFTKATALGPTVTLSMSPDIPVVIEYPIDTMGHIRYYLAPKIEED
jgi:proliferating cell nuclear antigen